jgi:putative addiction module killer protein
MALTVREYLTADGKNPFREWRRSLTRAVGARIQLRMQRFELGNLGDHKNVGQGVWEARVMFGPGYRIYLLRQGRQLDHRATRRRRQGIASEGHRAGTRILARLSGGETAWQGDMRTGMLGWRKIFGIRSLPENFYSERSTKTFRFRSRSARLCEPWA